MGYLSEFHSLSLFHLFGFPAETLRQRLEDLEEEKGRLPWVLPSQQPALGRFLGYLAAQTRVALYGAIQR